MGEEGGGCAVVRQNARTRARTKERRAIWQEKKAALASAQKVFVCSKNSTNTAVCMFYRWLFVCEERVCVCMHGMRETGGGLFVFLDIETKATHTLRVKILFTLCEHEDV
jgi:hypothetical protein